MVTGAAQGIGAAVSRSLAAEGAFVYALDIDRRRLDAFSEEVRRQRLSIEGVALDITDRHAVDEVVAHIERARPVDGLVNGAGILSAARFERATPESWLDTFNVNVHGTFHVSQSVARVMIPRGAGAIVTIASNANATPRVNMSAYCASKAAVAMLTKCMGLELGRHGIRCNVLSPGSTDTAMLRAIADGADGQRQLIEGDLSAYRVGIPLGRLAQPVDVAMAALFLLSDDARHVTLQDLRVDGGATF